MFVTYLTLLAFPASTYTNKYWSLSETISAVTVGSNERFAGSVSVYLNVLLPSSSLVFINVLLRLVIGTSVNISPLTPAASFIN